MSGHATDRTENLTIRITAETKAKLDEATKTGPYRLSKTSIVERGIDLAIEEIGRMNGGAK